LDDYCNKCEQQAMRDEGLFMSRHPLMNRRCTRLPEYMRLQNDLYCVGWGVKLCSLTPAKIARIAIVPHLVVRLIFFQHWEKNCFYIFMGSLAYSDFFYFCPFFGDKINVSCLYYSCFAPPYLFSLSVYWTFICTYCCVYLHHIL